MNSDVESNKLIGKRITSGRNFLSLSIEDTAKKIGVSVFELQRYEKGELKISANKLFNISRLFDAPIEYFLMEKNSQT